MNIYAGNLIFILLLNVDCIVSLSKLNRFLAERGVVCHGEKANATSVRFELKDEKQIAKIKELYRLDYEIPVGC